MWRQLINFDINTIGKQSLLAMNRRARSEASRVVVVSDKVEDRVRTLDKKPTRLRVKTAVATVGNSRSAGDIKKGTKLSTSSHKNDGTIVNQVTNKLLDLKLSDYKTSRGLKNIRRFSSASIARTLDDVAARIKNHQIKDIVVVVGAGISTASGVPDFRSPGTGLYSNLQQYKLPYPEAVFDMDYFVINPRPFFTLAKHLYPSGRHRPNNAHYFIRLLQDKGLLLRVYTQNIDGLERMAGVPNEKIVEAHGSFQTAACIECHTEHDADSVKNAIFADKIPHCKRPGCLGLVKPNIVFFGEDLPKTFYKYMKDIPLSDLIIVMGTSLEVQPFSSIIDSTTVTTPRILFNRDIVGPFRNSRRPNDVIAQGDITRLVTNFAELLGWSVDLVQVAESRQTELNEVFSTKITDDKKAEELKNCNQNVSDSSPSVSSNSKKSAGDVSSTLGNANLRNTENCAIRSTSINEGAKSNSQSSGNVGKANEKTPKITGLSGGKNVPILRGFSLPTLSVPRQRLFPAFHAQKKLYRTSSPVSSASPLNSGRTDSSSSCDDD